MEYVSVSKLMSETDLIDILFHTCDEFKSGRVPVSSLISYLEKMTDTKLQHREAVKKLAVCLDPKGVNCEVDLETYRHGMCTWIEQLGTSEDSSSDAEDGTHATTVRSELSVSGGSPSWRGSGGYVMESVPADDNARYTESDGVDVPWQSQLEDLQHVNKRLSEENNRLQAQLDQQEDTTLTLTHNSKILKEKIRRLQEVADLQQSEITAENEELKTALNRCQEHKQEKHSRILYLERDNAELTSQATDYETKINKLVADQETSRNLVKSLQATVFELKRAVQEAETIQKKQEMELSDKEQSLVEVKSNLRELYRLNEELKRSNDELQIHLSQAQQQLVRHNLQQQHSSIQRVLSSQGSESDDENSDEDDDYDENDDNVRPVPFMLPDLQLTVTTALSSSINSEIRDTWEEGRNSPCPLSPKEQSEMQASEDEMWILAEDLDLNDILHQLSDNTLESFMSALTKGWRSHRSSKLTPTATDGMERHRKSPSRRDGRSGKSPDTRGDRNAGGDAKQQFQSHFSERFKQFLLKVKELKEENQRLRQLHETSVDSVLNMEGEFDCAVSAADTRIIVLRDILHEERTQKTKLQEQVSTLKKILGIVDKKDSLDFETVKDTLCRQQDKIEHLKRSNLELAEKYHKTELKITDLQEDSLQAAQALEKEKHRCSRLEDAANTSALARQLDLREIWRLVQKDVETEYLDNQDESCISASTEEIKKRIIQEIKDREDKLQQQSYFVKKNLKERAAMSLPLHRLSGYGKVSSHCCGYRCASPSSPLVDALTIDFFNGNYYPLPKKPRAATAATDSYLNYLRMSCEDVDCTACRAYRLGLDFQGVSSCPSLQLKLGPHEIPGSLSYGGFHSVVTALNYNFNSQQAGYGRPQPGYNNNSQSGHTDIQGEGKGVVYSQPATTTYSTNSHPDPETSGISAPHNTSFNNSTVAGPRASPAVPSHTMMTSSSYCSSSAAFHRRLDFQRRSSRWTSGTTDSHASTSFESYASSTDHSYRHPPPPHRAHPPDPQTRGQESEHYNSSDQCSPAGFRRMSFLAAVDKSKGKEPDWTRRPSYRAAIDPRYLSGENSTNDHTQNSNGTGQQHPDGGYGGGVSSSTLSGDGRPENKTVTFRLQDTSHGSMDSRGSFISTSSFSSSSESDNSGWGLSVHSARGAGGNQPRKLSILMEEENGEDLLKTPERRIPMSPSSRTATPTHQHADFDGISERSGNTPSASDGAQRSGNPAFVHGSSARSAASADMKTFLIAPGEEGKGMASPPACHAGNMPAHFRRKGEVAAASTTSFSASAASAAPASSSAVVTSAASASSVLSSSSPQSLVLVPGSPPQTPRQTHDSHHVVPAAVTSRLATIRQNNLARKREQMKSMKMPELSEHAESDSELLSGSSNGTHPASKRSSARTSSSSTSSQQQQHPSEPYISVVSDDNDDTCRMDNTTSSTMSDSGGEEVLRPSSPTDDAVTPSIPESFLKQLGLSTENKDLANGDDSVDQLPDKQLENRFNSLALAFKTDRLTLEKRLGIQERSRDIAEQNIDKELQGLRDAIELLNSLCSDERVQEVISKIHHHLDILEHSVARVSSRAEVFGAVQQERRMCLAMDVMITFTENIRRLREKEQADVEEARKVLNERQVSSGMSLDSLGFGDRRSASMCVGMNNPRTTRRRSEVALPRFFGGAGSPSLHVSSSMSSLGSASKPSFADSLEAPMQKFQSATANMVIRNVVTNTLRRASLERQKNLSVQSSTTSSTSSSGPSRTNSVDKPQDKEELKKQHSQEEEAFRQGYEKGLKETLSRELTELRDQQTNINGNLEQVMDRVETLQQEDKEESDIDEAVSKLKDAVVKVRLWISNPNWHTASHTLRKIAAGIIFLIAMIVVIVTFVPLVPGNVELRNHGKPAQ
ncbi:uncharacterized protein [Littorina saxatilis]|uniref:uncharacterized protein isoform X2 n=1 Tax=Littorina saxatilis TaxID=31220 RepID=UPI0038B50FAA